MMARECRRRMPALPLSAIPPLRSVRQTISLPSVRWDSVERLWHSIAAVAQVELKTRQESDEIGTLVAISGSRYERQEPCACPVGTNFSVSNIFYNVPARRKFLKSNSTELNNILSAFERIALVNPQISFTLHSNGTEVFNLRAANLRQRILDVFGKKFNHDLLPGQCRDNDVQGFRICRQTGGCP